MWHRVKNPTAGFVELIVQFINTLGCFHPGTFLAGMVTHRGIPVFVVLMAVALDRANWQGCSCLTGREKLYTTGKARDIARWKNRLQSFLFLFKL